jgi:hypothetical protein
MKYPMLKRSLSSWVPGNPFNDPATTCNMPNTPVTDADGDGSYDGDFIFDMQSVYPEYLTDMNVLQCPSSAVNVLGDWNYGNDPANPVDLCAVVDLSYNYFGWMILDEHITEAGTNANDNPPTVNQYVVPTLTAIFTKRLAGDVGVYDKDQHYPDAANVHPLYRLREGVERIMITDINARAQGFRARIRRPARRHRANCPSYGTSSPSIPTRAASTTSRAAATCCSWTATSRSFVTRATIP